MILENKTAVSARLGAAKKQEPDSRFLPLVFLRRIIR
jgi:hypothetical protein